MKVSAGSGRNRHYQQIKKKKKKPTPLRPSHNPALALVTPVTADADTLQAAALTITAEKYMLVTPYMMIKMRASERLLKQ